MKKTVAYGCWSNERHIRITESDDAGCIHSALFKTEAAAREYYNPKLHRCLSDDPIVKVTVEVIKEKP